MHHAEDKQWEKLTVPPKRVFDKIEAGMSIFLSTGVAEPRSLVKLLMETDAPNLKDLELIQVISLSDAISLDELTAQKYRLKTFFSGWVASEAITAGRVDLIPSRFSDIPRLIASGQIPIDAAFVQITPPNEAGYCSLGVAVDVALHAMEKASLRVGEINPRVPVTFGDTFVPIADFDLLVVGTEEPIYFNRWPVHDVFDRIAANVASEIVDGSCIAFSIGPLFEALSRHLVHKRNLGVHTPFFTDALMDLVKSGAVTNRNKEVFRGKSVTSYGLGTPDLMCWLDRNPLIEFQSVDKVFSPNQIGRNPDFVCVLPARKVDVSGRVALHVGKGNVAAGPENAVDFVNGAELSRGGRTIFALPSRNLKGEANIRLSVETFPNEFSLREAIDMVVTEYGVAYLKGRTVRERAQALIDIAHPDDRPGLVEQAKEKRILYADQIYVVESAHLYPDWIATKHTFKGEVEVRFRAIKPSDEEAMRRLFYRFSDEAVYYRYFSPIKAMPHAKMQEYVNVDYSQTLPIVGLLGDTGEGRIVAEARFVRDRQRPSAEVAFVVDEEYQGLGIATYLLKRLVQLAKKQGIKAFTAEVLATNKGMMKVFEKSGLPIKAKMEYGIYSLTMPLETAGALAEDEHPRLERE
jgi:acyl-CoA hydrolase/ribosomal protein S18 acetylase RimI-like enzyme